MAPGAPATPRWARGHAAGRRAVTLRGVHGPPQGPHPLGRPRHAAAPDHPHERQAARAGRQQAVLFYGIEAMADAGIEEVGIIIAPETGDEIRAAAGDGSRFGVRDHLHRPGRARRPGPRGPDRRAVPRRRPFVMYLGDNLLQGGIAELVTAFRAQRARRADPAHAGPRPRALRGGRARTASRVVRLAEKPRRAGDRPRARRRLHVHAGDPRRRARDRAVARAASSRSPTRSSTWSTTASASSRTSCAAGGRTRAASRTCSRPTG